MNYSMNAKSRQQKQKERRNVLLISWAVFLIIGFALGFLICNLAMPSQAVDVKSLSDASYKPTDTAKQHSVTITPATFEITTEPITAPKERLISLGEYKLTAYCPCEKCCGRWGKDRPKDSEGNLLVKTASGAYAKQGVTVAADTSILPFGTVLLIDGNEYIVQDSGGAVKGNKVDIYFESHQEALEFGVQYMEIFIIERDDAT